MSKRFILMVALLGSFMSMIIPNANATSNELIKFIQTDHGLVTNTWKIRIKNIEIISDIKISEQMGLWCATEELNKVNTGNGYDEPCEIWTEELASAEGNVLEARNYTEIAIRKLKEVPSTREIAGHIKVLTRQLEELKMVNTPVFDAIKRGNGIKPTQPENNDKPK